MGFVFKGEGNRRLGGGKASQGGINIKSRSENLDKSSSTRGILSSVST